MHRSARRVRRGCATQPARWFSTPRASASAISVICSPARRREAPRLPGFHRPAARWFDAYTGTARARRPRCRQSRPKPRSPARDAACGQHRGARIRRRRDDVTPVTSSNNPFGGSSATNGVKRSHQSAMAESSFASAAASASMTLRCGNMARASASALPGVRPSVAAHAFTAPRRSALSTLATTTSGSARPEELGRRRSYRSVERHGSHSERMRRLAGLAENSVVTTPLHYPIPTGAVPVAGKLRIKAWRAPIRVRCRWRRTHSQRVSALLGCGFAPSRNRNAVTFF